MSGVGRTSGGTILTLTGANFGVTTPTVTMGAAGPVTAAPCRDVVRLSHWMASCVLPEGSGVNTTVYLTVPGTPPGEVAVWAGFRYSPPTVDTVTTADVVAGAAAGVDPLAGEAFVWRREVAVAGGVGADANYIQGACACTQRLDPSCPLPLPPPPPPAPSAPPSRDSAFALSGAAFLAGENSACTGVAPPWVLVGPAPNAPAGPACAALLVQAPLWVAST